MKLNILTILLLGSMLCGCKVGPDYRTPRNFVPDEWNGLPCKLEIDLLTSDPQVDWWTIFNDCLLDKYIEMAARNNKDLLTAESNILQARAMKWVAASNFFPQITGDVNATRTFFSKNGPLFSTSIPGLSPPPPTQAGHLAGPSNQFPFQVQIPPVQNLFNALFDATWEIDLFGKTLRNIEASERYIESVVEQRNNVLLTILAEVATNYIQVRSNQRRAQLIEQDIQLLEKNTEVARRRLSAGYSNLLDLERIEAQLSADRANLPNIKAQIYRSIYSLSILTGNLPEALEEELLIVEPLPKTPTHIAVGLRSDLLRRRPDVRKAERLLAQATANIGVAVAQFYPTITLGAFEGFQIFTFEQSVHSKKQNLVDRC